MFKSDDRQRSLEVPTNFQKTHKSKFLPALRHHFLHLQPPDQKKKHSLSYKTEETQFINQFTMDESQVSPVISTQITVNDAVTSLTLTSDGKLRWEDGGRRCLTVEKDLIGVVIEGGKLRVKSVVDDGDGICCWGSKGVFVRKDFLFQAHDADSLSVFCQHLRANIDSLGRPKRLFVFVNPFGGKRSATKIFLDVVKPLLQDADVQITIQETKHRLHAKEVVSTMDLTMYDGIVCVSGDGILVEVINGLLSREDWKTAIKIPIGMVPAGTGNGMAKSLLDFVGEPCNPANAVVSIIRGHKRSVDVATVMQGETKFFSVLMLAWGLVADIDIESEKYRWMGSARIDFYALQRISHLRHYNGRVSFVPAPGYETHGEPTSYNGESASTQSIQNTSEDLEAKIQRNYQGPDVDLKRFDWRFIAGPFISVWLHNVPWGGEDVKAAPSAQFSDGYMDLILVRDCPKLSLLSLMTDMGNGGHIKSPYVQYLKVKAFVLEPGMRKEDASKGGIIDVDGEVLARGNGTYTCDEKALMTYDRLQITIDQGLATVFSPVDD